ncbi:MAG: hypothetical protein UT63_C0019G0002 [Candidatus Gottesmanbacteria bacterium GW2011_GWC2_39_8]|uniref:Uncharacterized protein n=1 Tax=Candidatus Gottesmanbacteria bacterium GW2011_GWC2_39_8 TaxID=1618450 RepID=A0A0G0SEY4_9BACT|nr:MAG: hypothetical protein UT63_C0019G0002 [Candidatus Gottesmanbacteria bacterium GW2011_GWC2_39_8]
MAVLPTTLIRSRSKESGYPPRRPTIYVKLGPRDTVVSKMELIQKQDATERKRKYPLSWRRKGAIIFFR